LAGSGLVIGTNVEVRKIKILSVAKEHNLLYSVTKEQIR